MRHRFQALPGYAGRPLPVIDLVVEGLELAPQACLLDIGAAEIRMSEDIAGLAGIDLSGGISIALAVGGVRTTGRGATVQLELRQRASQSRVEPHRLRLRPLAVGVWPARAQWPDPFVLTMNTYEEWSELKPQ